MCLIAVLVVPALGAASLSNFSAQRDYQDKFADVSANAWYYDGIKGAYEYGIMDGKSANSFDPAGNLTIAETLKLAANLHKIYFTGKTDFEAGSPWYSPYVEYALENEIIEGPYVNYSAAATRSDFALIIAGAIPEEATTPINRVTDGAIPDVYEYYSYGLAVYRLYRAGILTGSDSEGTFFPGRTLTRAEAATIIMRIMRADMRRNLTLRNKLTAEEVYKKASPAVFYVEVFNEDGDLIKTGSGFFISESGLAVTNYHVVVGGHSAQIKTDTGDVRDVTGIYDYDWKNDIVVLQIDVGNVPYLERADLSKLKTGATVFALGSPLRLEDTFSSGIVSQAQREIEGVTYIQVDAPISSGSSGGALLDSYGMVIGVTCATAPGAQNINLATPIDRIDSLSLDALKSFESILIKAEYYPKLYPAPDFGAYFGIKAFYVDAYYGGADYSYLLSDLPEDVDKIIDEYSHLVEQNLFIYTGYVTYIDAEYKVYYNSEHYLTLMFGFDTVKGKECFTIMVY